MQIVIVIQTKLFFMDKLLSRDVNAELVPAYIIITADVLSPWKTIIGVKLENMIFQIS